MNRRRFVAAIAGVFAGPLHAAVEQSTKIYRIGWLDLGPTRRLEEFRDSLRQLGWIEGRTIFIEERFAGNKPDRLAGLASELVKLEVDVIVTASTPAARAVSIHSVPVSSVGMSPAARNRRHSAMAGNACPGSGPATTATRTGLPCHSGGQLGWRP